MYTPWRFQIYLQWKKKNKKNFIWRQKTQFAMKVILYLSSRYYKGWWNAAINHHKCLKNFPASEYAFSTNVLQFQVPHAVLLPALKRKKYYLFYLTKRPLAQTTKRVYILHDLEFCSSELKILLGLLIYQFFRKLEFFVFCFQIIVRWTINEHLRHK